MTKFINCSFMTPNEVRQSCGLPDLIDCTTILDTAKQYEIGIRGEYWVGQSAPIKPKRMRCAYCGTKQKMDTIHCTSCGAPA